MIQCFTVPVVLGLDHLVLSIVLSMSTGTGKMMVLLFSAEMLFRVCRYRN